MNEEHKAFAKEISEMLTNMYDQGFADCEAVAKIAIEAGIKKAMLAEREACAVVCENFTKQVNEMMYPFNGQTSETKFVNSISDIVAKTFSAAIRARGEQ
jgi:hypothetical protein